jgi:dolichyl-phosphate-mannose--protein O-mannosyl transferase
MLFNLDNEQNKKLAIRGIVAVFLVSVALRFWGLGRFNVFVFDEVYYAKFANNYLTNTKFFNSHPPLSQYLIAIGIWIGDMLPIGRDNVNELTGSLRSTISYRWMNALFGSLIPPLVAALAYQLNQRLSFAFLAGLFIALDGLYLVDSRYALNNIYLVFFGLLGQLLVLIASRYSGNKQLLYLMGAGASFGASIACKWNGLSFLLGIYAIVVIAKIFRGILAKQIEIEERTALLYDLNRDENYTGSLFDRLSKLDLVWLFIGLAIVPIIVYSLLWIPHLIQNPTPNFLDVQWQILTYHEQVGNGSGIHPYCANWYTWPLLLRPLAYYFKEYKEGYYYDVHAMGNPLLWWLALLAIFGSVWSIFKEFILGFSRILNIHKLSIPLFIVVNYAVNLLPWVKVTRCLFIYHYMGAVLFAIVGLAWWVDISLRSNSRALYILGLTTIFSIGAAFVFWLPIYLGLSIEKTQLSLRLWDFWIFDWI